MKTNRFLTANLFVACLLLNSCIYYTGIPFLEDSGKNGKGVIVSDNLQCTKDLSISVFSSEKTLRSEYKMTAYLEPKVSIRIPGSQEHHSMISGVTRIDKISGGYALHTTEFFSK